MPNSAGAVQADQTGRVWGRKPVIWEYKVRCVRKGRMQLNRSLSAVAGGVFLVRSHNGHGQAGHRGTHRGQ